jgi:methyl-accepting chemotaxis protein
MDNKELPSVADLSKALKERIKKYGGVTAVWERLDSRFKDNGTRRIEGKKMRSKGKITFEAFKKAYERLDKDLAKPDKMTFGISGNPLLLNNVFQTLGLNNGYGGLLEIEYKEPELIDRIIGIELSLKETVQKINSLADRIENMHRKSTRTEKVSKDFETILGRLYSIFKQNKDQSLQDPFYAMRKKEDINNLISDALKAVSENNFSKLNKTQKLFSSKLESASRLVNVVSLSISNLELEAERISLLLMVYDDYKEYIYRNKILLEYYKLKEGKFVGNDNFATLNIYITSPLYILLLFLQIAVLFLKKLGAA